MIQLSVNLNKIALLRNSRTGQTPSVLSAAKTVISAGAHGITVHPRPDQRHIRPDDVYALSELLNSEYPDIEFNIEGNPSAGPRENGYPGFDALINKTRPHQCTLVPDGDNQLTSDHGWDLEKHADSVSRMIEKYHHWGARVSLFMDPDEAQITLASQVGADRIELYTGPFADTVQRYGVDARQSLDSLAVYALAAQHAAQLGLGVNAGHDLNLQNLPLFRTITPILEVSIGHALICDALNKGLFQTVLEYLHGVGNPPKNH
ncbi:MAG: pyridoxine 5'-phosphate synthase [Pseudomonadales bacterium]|nr:pyridoxine 5'-phosphate synthase [Pseudomonadales bacterium]